MRSRASYTGLAIAVMIGITFVETHQGYNLMVRAGNRIGELVSVRFRGDEAEMADIGQLHEYRKANAHLAPDSERIVIYGDSIVVRWAIPLPLYVINRGVGGETSSIMLIRFRQDVLDLNPRAVVILAGTNDLLWSENQSSFTRFQDNIMTMTELAQSRGIEVVLCSILPMHNLFPSQPHQYGITVPSWNAWLKNYSTFHGATYVNFYPVLATTSGDFDPTLTDDGVHPNEKGYKMMDRILADGLTHLSHPATTTEY